MYSLQLHLTWRWSVCHGTKYPSPQVMVHPEQFTLIPRLGSGYSGDPGWSQDFSSPDEKDRGKSSYIHF